MSGKRKIDYEVKQNRANDIHKLVKSLDKPLRKITKKDFREHNLGSLLNYYRGSPKRALIDIGYDPGPMKKPKGYWNKMENRMKAVYRVMELTKKKSTELRKTDFIKNGYSLVVKNRTMKELLNEANLPFKQYQKDPGYWSNKRNRIREMKNLVEKLGKNPSSITKQDITENGLSTILNKHRGSIRSVMKEAGFEVKKKKPPKYWNKKENRVKAVKKFFKKLDKDPSEIRRKDFVNAGLQSLLLKYRDELAAEYEKGDILKFDKGYLLKYKTTIDRALAEAKILK